MKCARCDSTATLDLHGHPMCADCAHVWCAAAPFPKDIESRAEPEHFDETEYGPQLKPEILAQWYRAWTSKWLKKSRAV